jgi:hypothetical protein
MTMTPAQQRMMIITVITITNSMSAMRPRSIIAHMGPRIGKVINCTAIKATSNKMIQMEQHVHTEQIINDAIPTIIP